MRKFDWNTVSRRSVMGVTGLLFFSLTAVADPVSFPLSLNPMVSNAYLLAAYSKAATVSGDEETNSTGVTTAQTGVLNLASIASGPGGGAYADLIHGALGIDSVGQSDGGAQISEAVMIVNVTLTGAGINTVNFDINGSSAVDGCVNFSCQNTFMPRLSVYSVGGGIQATTGSDSCEGAPGCTGIPFPENLSLGFQTTAQSNIYQFQFALTGISDGFAGIFAANTGLISFNLAPGVTMDTSFGFLTQPGDPHLGGSGNSGGSTAVPEPSSSPLLGGVGLIALWLIRERLRRASWRRI